MPESYAIKIYRNHFKSLIDKYHSVNIYSLNYDPLASLALNFDSNFITGFEKEKRFDTRLYLRAPNALTFLHGHICFVPLENRMLFENDFQPAQNKRFKNLWTSTSTKFLNPSVMKGTTYNTYLITGLDKIEAFANNPFSAYFYRFAKDLIESDCIVIMGASLSDDHLNSFLRNYFAEPKNKIIFVTLLEPTRIRRDKSLTNLMSFFTYDPSSINPINGFDDLASSVEQVGFGRLTNNVALYGNGSKSFFENGDPEEILNVFEESL